MTPIHSTTHPPSKMIDRSITGCDLLDFWWLQKRAGPLALVLLFPEPGAVTETGVLSQDTYFLHIQCVWVDGATKLSKIYA